MKPETSMPSHLRRTCIALLMPLAVLAAHGVEAATAVKLNVLWRVVVGSYDRMTTPSAIERDAFPLEGAIFYLPTFNITGTRPVYRLFNGSTDHMESLFSAESNYYSEGVLGHAWMSPSSTPGLHQIIRTWNTSTGDHATRHPFESLPGYLDEPLGVYGYARPNNTALSPLSLTAGGVTITSNAVAGGALWNWTWNGIQFINNSDYGRQIQSDVVFTGGNPTEAGDQYSYGSIIPAARHGSPLVYFYNSGSTQVTRSIPLQFEPAALGGGPDNPVAWTDVTLGKEITLNFNNMGPVAKYTTVVTVPNSLAVDFIEVPTGYLRANFNRYWTYNAATQAISEVSPDNCPGDWHGTLFYTAFGGVIVSDSTGNAAMGVYGVDVANGGSVTGYSLYRFFCANDGSGEFAFDTSKWTAAFQGVIPAGGRTFNVWIMTGTLTAVQGYMRSLYLAGVR